MSDHLLTAEDAGCGKTRQEIKIIAENLVREKGILRRGKITNGWWQVFLKRNPKIRLRHGDSTAHVRMDAINKETIQSYFALLKDIYTTHNLDAHPELIYIMDKAGMPLSPRPPKLLHAKVNRR